MSWFKRTPHPRRVEKKHPYHSSLMSEKLFKEAAERFEEKQKKLDEEVKKEQKIRRD